MAGYSMTPDFELKSDNLLGVQSGNKEEDVLKTINSVLGPLSTDKLGVTLMHEHVQGSCAGLPQVYPEFLGEDYMERIVSKLKETKDGGIDTMVEAGTFDLGRDARMLAEASRLSGMNIIAATGVGVGGVPPLLGTFDADQWAKVFVREITVGMEGTDIKAGIIKTASDFGGVQPSMEIALRGMARAQVQTGVPMTLHSYAAGQVARQQIAILKEEGVAMDRVKIDHLLDTTDLEYITWIADQGCYLGMDRMPQDNFNPRKCVSLDGRINTLKALIDLGYTKSICLSHDEAIVSSLIDTLPQWHRDQLHEINPHLFLFINKVVWPRLREMGVSEATRNEIMVENPRRFFEGTPR